jgi:hydroxymethylbilane synthase
MNKLIRIGTRGSELALWQANHVKNQLEHLGFEVSITILKTQGDNIQHLSFDKLEGKGFFTKEIEEALLNKSVDLAVHSHKDLPTTNPPGLVIAAVSDREDPADLMLVRKEFVDKTKLFNVKEGASIGTSSLRRRTQLQCFRADVTVKDLRGNVPTRIQKLRDGLYDAIVIAYAGVERLKLDISDLHAYKIPAWQMVPAPAQGVLALQVREEDQYLIEAMSSLNSIEVQNRISVERGVLNLFDGGCQLPLGVYCERENDTFKVSVSKAENAHKSPVRMYFESKSNERMHQHIVHAFRSISPKKIFISSGTNDFTFFQKSLIDNGFTVHAESLIEVSAVAFTNFPKTDWIFFNSKNAARFFFASQPSIGDTKIAAVGIATATYIRSLGYEVSFVGEEHSTKITAKSFAKKIQKETVLFPQSKQSLQTIAANIPQEQRFVIDVYETVEKSDELNLDAEIVVFTSPSNVRAFLNKNSLKEKKVVSIGSATAFALQGVELLEHHVARKPSELCILEKVYELSVVL